MGQELRCRICHLRPRDRCTSWYLILKWVCLWTFKGLWWFVDAVRFHLGILVENVGDLTSYSLRRVGPSVAGLAELSEPEKVALGGWIDKNHGVAATPARYDATKERLSCQLKMALRYTLLWIINTMGFGTWGQVSMRACSSINSPKSSPLERGQREEKSHSFYTSGKGKLLGFQSLRPSQLMN